MADQEDLVVPHGGAEAPAPAPPLVEVPSPPSADPDPRYAPEALAADLISLEDEREKRRMAERPWRSLHEHVEEIEHHKHDPWVALRLGSEELLRLRSGAMAVIVGGPGSGKSTLAANLLWQHAAEVGVAIMHSVELPGMEFTARLVGLRTDSSWVEVLTGRVPYEEMQRVTALERFTVLERDFATLANLRRCAEAMAKRHPKLPILVAVDYVQILENERSEGGPRSDERLRIADIVKAIDKLARDLGLVVLALSQMSTANAKAARAGEALGNDAGELAAETSAFNRYATTAMSIGKKSDPFQDGSRTVELSIGKFRMGEGDRVVPMREWGRSGLWRVDGEAKTAQEVRESRDAERAAKVEQALEAQLIGVAQRSTIPLSRDQLMDQVSGRKANKRTAITKLLASGELVEVAQRAPRSRLWMIWTITRVEQTGLALASGAAGGAP